MFTAREDERTYFSELIFVLPLRSTSSRGRGSSRLVLFNDVFNVMAGIQTLSVTDTGPDHVLRRRAACWAWNIEESSCCRIVYFYIFRKSKDIVLKIILCRIITNDNTNCHTHFPGARLVCRTVTFPGLQKRSSKG